MALSDRARELFVRMLATLRVVNGDFPIPEERRNPDYLRRDSSGDVYSRVPFKPGVRRYAGRQDRYRPSGEE